MTYLSQISSEVCEISVRDVAVLVPDEALSPETGKETEFVVVMSDQPQGGIKNRTPGRER